MRPFLVQIYISCVTFINIYFFLELINHNGPIELLPPLQKEKKKKKTDKSERKSKNPHLSWRPKEHLLSSFSITNEVRIRREWKVFFSFFWEV